MGELSTGAHKVHFIEGGFSGQPVVFVHGSCGAGSQWSKLAQTITDRFHTFQIDLPGCGQNTPWPSDEPWQRSVDTLAIECLLSVINKPAHLVVHSAGGHLAIDAILQNSEKLISLTMFEPTYFNLLQDQDRHVFVQPDKMAKEFRQHFEEGQIDQAMRSFVDTWSKKNGTWTALPEPIKQSMKQTAPRLYHEWNQIYGDVPTPEQLCNLNIPMMLVNGSDTLDSMHMVCATIKKSVPNLHHKEIKGAGHMCPFTHVAEIAPVFRDFLERSG